MPLLFSKLQVSLLVSFLAGVLVGLLMLAPASAGSDARLRQRLRELEQRTKIIKRFGASFYVNGHDVWGFGCGANPAKWSGDLVPRLGC